MIIFLHYLQKWDKININFSSLINFSPRMVGKKNSSRTKCDYFEYKYLGVDERIFKLKTKNSKSYIKDKN